MEVPKSMVLDHYDHGDCAEGVFVPLDIDNKS